MFFNFVVRWNDENNLIRKFPELRYVVVDQLDYSRINLLQL